MRLNGWIFCLIVVALSAQGCKVFYPNVMFRMDDDYDYTEFEEMPVEEYEIMPGDEFTMQVFTNDNYNNVISIVPTFEGGSGGAQQRGGVPYLVRFDSLAKLPVIGEVNLVGFTAPEAESFIAKEYSKYYESPFVRIQVTNRRVIIYTGGSGQIVTLDNENMSLIEVLAKAGGIQGGAKAYEVKVIRGDLNDPDIAKIDLSTIEGVKDANLRVQANDIIYIEPRMRITTGVLREISPFIGLITSATTLYLLYLNLRTRNGN